MSDLHLEFSRELAQRFVNSLDVDGVDVLVIAGDIAVGAAIEHQVSLIAKRFDGIPILYVNGNHEYYGAGRKTVRTAIRRLHREYSNVHHFECEAIEIKGQRFLGTTLWYEPNAKVRAGMPYWSDFRLITSLQHWIREAHNASIDFLDKNLQENDIVISHMLPSHKCVAPRWQLSDTNHFFVTDVEKLILERKPRYWIHGHTHDSIDVRIGNTRVVCNPRGYEGYELNPYFDPKATLIAAPLVQDLK